MMMSAWKRKKELHACMLIRFASASVDIYKIYLLAAIYSSLGPRKKLSCNLCVYNFFPRQLLTAALKSKVVLPGPQKEMNL